jgi:hypothetical protein
MLRDNRVPRAQIAKATATDHLVWDWVVGTADFFRACKSIQKVRTIFACFIFGTDSEKISSDADLHSRNELPARRLKQLNAPPAGKSRATNFCIQGAGSPHSRRDSGRLESFRD